MSAETELKCSGYVMCDNAADFRPCNCPVCGGFLNWNDGEPTCSKCGAGLLVIPDRDEETGEELEYGKICPISLGKKAART